MSLSPVPLKTCRAEEADACKDELEKSTDFYHLPPGWCLIKYVPYLPIELFLALSLVVCPQLLRSGQGQGLVAGVVESRIRILMFREDPRIECLMDVKSEEAHISLIDKGLQGQTFDKGQTSPCWTGSLGSGVILQVSPLSSD
ncbi:hypothetical protein TNCV_133161 [Trichonephila clavipes]|nr:hypothetical protein TNCV_133161 [Trichonephila clavipes]